MPKTNSLISRILLNCLPLAIFLNSATARASGGDWALQAQLGGEIHDIAVVGNFALIARGFCVDLIAGLDTGELRKQGSILVGDDVRAIVPHDNCLYLACDDGLRVATLTPDDGVDLSSFFSEFQFPMFTSIRAGLSGEELWVTGHHRYINQITYRFSVLNSESPRLLSEDSKSDPGSNVSPGVLPQNEDKQSGQPRTNMPQLEQDDRYLHAYPPASGPSAEPRRASSLLLSPEWTAIAFAEAQLYAVERTIGLCRVNVNDGENADHSPVSRAIVGSGEMQAAGNRLVFNPEGTGNVIVFDPASPTAVATLQLPDGPIRGMRPQDGRIYCIVGADLVVELDTRTFPDCQVRELCRIAGWIDTLAPAAESLALGIRQNEEPCITYADLATGKTTPPFPVPAAWPDEGQTSSHGSFLDLCSTGTGCFIANVSPDGVYLLDSSGSRQIIDTPGSYLYDGHILRMHDGILFYASNSATSNSLYGHITRLVAHPFRQMPRQFEWVWVEGVTPIHISDFRFSGTTCALLADGEEDQGLLIYDLSEDDL